MTKRVNPFGEGSPLQLKSHISEKELKSELFMKNVYDHTRDLLYKGAQTHNTTPNVSSADSVEEQETAASLQPLPGQLRLNSQGKLCNEPTKQIVCKEMEPRIQLPTQSSPLKQLRLDARCQLYNGDVGESAAVHR